MNTVDPGLAFFGVIGFVVFIWGGAWIGFKIEETAWNDRVGREINDGKLEKNVDYSLRMGDSVGAFIGGSLAFVIAAVIRHGF